MDYIFEPYSSIDEAQVKDKLVSANYLVKYINDRIPYLLLSKLGLYINYFYVLKTTLNNEVIGSILIRRRLSSKTLKISWWIYGVYIIESQRGKGISKVLVVNAIKFMSDKKVKDVFLYVDKKNEPAIKLYENLGFETIKWSNDHSIRNHQYLMKYTINGDEI